MLQMVKTIQRIAMEAKWMRTMAARRARKQMMAMLPIFKSDEAFTGNEFQSQCAARTHISS